VLWNSGDDSGRGGSRGGGHRVGHFVGGGRVGLLDGQGAAAVEATVDALGVARVEEVLFVDAVAQTVRDAADDGAPDLAGGHLAQLCARRVRVEGGVWRAQQVRRFLQRAFKQKKQSVFMATFVRLISFTEFLFP